jgi:hypothetical protein
MLRPAAGEMPHQAINDQRQPPLGLEGVAVNQSVGMAVSI